VTEFDTSADGVSGWRSPGSVAASVRAALNLPLRFDAADHTAAGAAKLEIPATRPAQCGSGPDRAPGLVAIGLYIEGVR